MALIRLEEAIDLGLVPLSAANRFPALARTPLFGSPLRLGAFPTLRPGASPLERQVGFQYGRAGIAPPRFGLGPLAMRLGLSPLPSAVGTPGVVPVAARQAARRPRTQEEELAILGQLAAAGALPGLLPPFAAQRRAAVADPVQQVAARLGVPTQRVAQLQRQIVAAQDAGMNERQILDMARRGIGLSRDVLNDQSLLRQVIDPLLQSAPPAAPGPTTEAAFGAQRAGERAPFGAPSIVPEGLTVDQVQTLEGVLGPLSAQEAGLLTDQDIAALAGLADSISSGGALPTALEAVGTGASVPGGVPEGGGPGILASVAPWVNAAAALGTVGGGVAGIVQSLFGEGPAPRRAVQGTFGAGQVAQGLGGLVPKETFLSGLEGGATLGGTAAGAAAAQAANVGAAGAGGAASGFGSLAGEAAELAATTPAAAGALSGAAPTLSAGLGATGTALAVMDAIGLLMDLAGQNRGGPATLSGGLIQGLIGGGSKGPFFDIFGGGKGSIPSSVVSTAHGQKAAGKFVTALAGAKTFADLQRTITTEFAPNAEFQIGSYGTPGYIGSWPPGPGNPERRAFLNALTELNTTGTPEQWQNFAKNLWVQGPGQTGAVPPNPEFTQALQGIFRAGLAQQDPWKSPEVQALTQGWRQAETDYQEQLKASAQQDYQAPEPTAGFFSVHTGGIIPRTGLYQLQEGELVIPATKNKDGVFEARLEHKYLPLSGGPPREAKSNPDPAKYWRLAFSAAEAKQALAEGDPGEMPIVLGPQALQFGPRRLVAAAEAARRIQHANPESTFGDFLDRLDAEAQSGVSVVPEQPLMGPQTAEEMDTDRGMRQALRIPSVYEGQSPLSQEELSPSRHTIQSLYPGAGILGLAQRQWPLPRIGPMTIPQPAVGAGI